MSARIDYMKTAPELFKKLVQFGHTVDEGSIEVSIVDLVAVRTSQLNGCSFCLDMHVKLAALHGEHELRLHHLAGWRESTLFSARERAALAWTEVLTKLPEHGVSNELYEQVRAEFSERELCDLTYSVMTTNAWNRINVAFQTVPGSCDKAFGLDKAVLR